VVDVAGDGGWNVERMEALSPGLVLGSPAYDLSTRGWPMVPITEYLEAHPLGRAEWMVPLAWMMGDSLAGAQAFADIRDRYEALKGQGMTGAQVPKVLMGSVADGVWHAPGQNTFVSRWVEDAGGQYALTEEDHDSNVTLGLEQVLEHAAQCDLWMMVVQDPDSFTVSDLLAQDPKHRALLEATDEVWVCNTAKHDYFGALVVQPDFILEDLQSAMQLGLVGPHGTFKPLSSP
jgi:iron complex transport system substrate-binding protein